MGDLPLRTPIHRRLGGPLPRLLPNGTHAHPPSPRLAGPPCGGPAPSGLNLPFGRLSRDCGQVAYALLTRAPVVSGASSLLPLDLHVLGLSLAFILSQDQTLRCMNCSFLVLMDFRCLFFLTVALLVAFLSFLFVYRQYLKDLSSLVTPEPSGPSGLPRLVCGCKGRTFFLNLQTFSEVFFRPFRPFFRPRPALRPRRLPLESGCKSSPFPLPLQTFRHVFFGYFRLFLLAAGYEAVADAEA